MHSFRRSHRVISILPLGRARRRAASSERRAGDGLGTSGRCPGYGAMPPGRPLGPCRAYVHNAAVSRTLRGRRVWPSSIFETEQFRRRRLAWIDCPWTARRKLGRYILKSMAGNGEGVRRPRPTYVVLEEITSGTWRILGEVQRRPGLPARRGRAQAVADALGHEPSEGARYAVIPLSEWRNGCDW